MANHLLKNRLFLDQFKQLIIAFSLDCVSSDNKSDRAVKGLLLATIRRNLLDRNKLMR